MQGGTYSFLDTQVTLSGVGGSVRLGSDAAVAEEGITFSYKEEKNTQTTGSDGSVMNNLHASNTARMTVRLLKTSTVNKVLSDMFNLQKKSSAAWGRNTISLQNNVSGDKGLGTFVAFVKHPDLTYAKDGGMNEWEFDIGNWEISLGGGTIGAILAFGA